MPGLGWIIGTLVCTYRLACGGGGRQFGLQPTVLPRHSGFFFRKSAECALRSVHSTLLHSMQFRKGNLPRLLNYLFCLQIPLFIFSILQIDQIAALEGTGSRDKLNLNVGQTENYNSSLKHLKNSKTSRSSYFDLKLSTFVKIFEFYLVSQSL